MQNQEIFLVFDHPQSLINICAVMKAGATNHCFSDRHEAELTKQCILCPPLVTKAL